MAYATPAELQTLMGRDDDPFTSGETARAVLLLDLATGAIDGELGLAELGESLELGVSTAEVDGTGTHLLLLPRWPVTAVESVAVIDDLDEPADALTEDTDYRWSRHGQLRRLRRCWPRIERAVEVVYTAGWDPIPNDVKGMCLRLASAGWDNIAGLESERLGDWSAKWSVPGMNLSTTDLRTLSLYRVRT